VAPLLILKRCPASTRRLMVEFYRNWREKGMSKREALRAAKQTLAADPQFAAPHYWAPFVLYGMD
jgi:CHAT domain-containing protein